MYVVGFIDLFVFNGLVVHTTWVKSVAAQVLSRPLGM